MVFLAKDFIETGEGLMFAVVESGLEKANKVLCFLRYYRTGDIWVKLNTKQANQLLNDHYPRYLYFSQLKQAALHAVNSRDIIQHYQPVKRLTQILQKQQNDPVLADCHQLGNLFGQTIGFGQMGVTGSILIGAHNKHSDIDLVFYHRKQFNQARSQVQQFILSGNCTSLTTRDWQASYLRRNCELKYSDYLWHERRKFNKAMINHRKFDLSLVLPPDQKVSPDKIFKKLQPCQLIVQIQDDSQSFDYPAKYSIDHSKIDSIVSYTATYSGQAKAGEIVEVSGQLEQAEDGRQRIIVGSDREAKGEYIRVIQNESSI